MAGVKGKSGRKPKATEQQILDRLSPLEGAFIEAMQRGLEETQGWAVKIFADYYWGKPKERLEVTSEEGIKNITFTVVKTNQDEIQD
jgi:hypothetical protein